MKKDRMLDGPIDRSKSLLRLLASSYLLDKRYSVLHCSTADTFMAAGKEVISSATR